MYCPEDKYHMLRLADAEENRFVYYCQHCDVYRDDKGNALSFSNKFVRHVHKRYHEKQLEKRVAELEARIKELEKGQQ